MRGEKTTFRSCPDFFASGCSLGDDAGEVGGEVERVGGMRGEWLGFLASDCLVGEKRDAGIEVEGEVRGGLTLGTEEVEVVERD